MIIDKKIYMKDWRKNNKEHLKEYSKNYRETNPEKVKKYKSKFYSISKNRLSRNITETMRKSLKGNKGSRHWEDLVDYTLQDLMIHLEKQFKEGMNWNNMGKWHIDHIIPIDFFNFNSYEDEEFKQCWALSNLQPLWASENLKKSNKI